MSEQSVLLLFKAHKNLRTTGFILKGVFKRAQTIPQLKEFHLYIPPETMFL